MEKLLKGKVVLITGSSIGIGRESAYLFSGEGCSVIITYYKDKKEGEETAKKCTAIGAETLLINLNIMDDSSIKEAVKKSIAKFGKIDILVNNAGVISWKNLEEQTHQEIEEQIRTNLEGLIKMTLACLPYVKEAIINVASGAGKTGYSGLSVYCATKFGVRGFTQSLAGELKGIKVYSVNPGTTSTRMTNFRGVSAEKVAQVILNTAKGKYQVSSGSDID